MADAVFVFDAQSLQDLRARGLRGGQFIKPGHGRLIGFEPGLAFLLFGRPIILYAQTTNENRQAQSLQNQRDQNDDEGEEKD